MSQTKTKTRELATPDLASPAIATFPRIAFMSGPKATADSRRTYLFRESETGPSYLVRIYPEPSEPLRTNTFLCDCDGSRSWSDDGTTDGAFTQGGPVRAVFIKFDGCVHMRAVYMADAERFYPGRNKINVTKN